MVTKHTVAGQDGKAAMVQIHKGAPQWATDALFLPALKLNVGFLAFSRLSPSIFLFLCLPCVPIFTSLTLSLYLAAFVLHAIVRIWDKRTASC